VSTSITSSGVLLNQEISARSKRERSARYSKLIPAALFFITLLFELWVRFETIQAGYVLEALRAHALASDVALREVRSEYALVSSPSVVRERASQMGMKETMPRQVRRVDGGR
jgi:hypothetical protein